MVQNVLDVFRQDAYSSLTLSRLVNKNPFIPGRLGKYGARLFAPALMNTTGYMVDVIQGQISLIPVTPRGAPFDQRAEEKRTSFYLQAPRIKRGTSIRADELQGVRDYSDPMQLMSLETMVARKLMGPTGLTKQFELTWESFRLQCLCGNVQDVSGTYSQNFFTLFGITPPTPINFNLVAATAGTLKPLINETIRTMVRASQGCYIEDTTQIMALCGDNFFDLLIQHPDVVQTYNNWYAAATLREKKAFMEFDFGGITWVNYRGTDDNTTIAIGTNNCRLFMLDAPGLFEIAWAPGEAFDEVNQIGRPMNVRTVIDEKYMEKVEFVISSFPLFVCLRPETLQCGIAASGDPLVPSGE